MLKTRIISAVIGVPLIALILLGRGYFLFFTVLALSFIGLYEYYRAMRHAKMESADIMGYILTAAYFGLLLMPGGDNYMGLLLAAFIITLFTYEILCQKHTIINIAVTLFGVAYIPFLFSHLIYIGRFEYASLIIWLPFLTAWFTDTCAYFVGVSMGKKKITPKISPNKTLEGAVGGIVGCVLLNMGAGLVFGALGYELPIIHFAVTGLLCGITSELGDLAASYIKRFSGVKDFGNVIPGHGGILDRFDSILFTAPTIYYYFLLIGNIL